MKKILLCHLMFFYTSVFCAGIQNIVTQMFFDTYYPAQKEIYLPLALLLASIATISGIAVSSGRRSHPPLVLALLVVCSILAFSGLFFAHNVVWYILLFCMASFAVNYVYNVFDPFLGRMTPISQKANQVKILLTYQMLGYIFAPVFFSQFVSRPTICIAVVVCLGIVSYAGVFSYYCSERSANEQPQDAPVQQVILRDSNDKQLLTFCFIMFTAFYLFLSSVAYFFQDYLKYADYSLASSLFLGGVVLCSSIVIALVSGAKLLRCIRFTPMLSLAGLLILCLNTHRILCVMFAAAVVIGLGYGAFLSAGKYYINRADPRKKMIEQYNKIMTVASLCAFLLSAFIGWISVQFSLSAIICKTGAVIVLLLVSAAIYCFSEKQDLRHS